MTQRDLAAAADTPQPAIARIESGAVEPRLATLERLLAAAGSQLESWPALGIGVDRSLIRAALAHSPEERIRRAGREGRNLARLLDEVGRDRGRR
jgi:predicted transcriptional regulator